MRLRNIFHDFKGFDRVYDYSYRINHMITDTAQKRLEIIEFFNKYGLEATKDAYKMSKATIYKWRKKYLSNDKDVVSLNIKSTKPINTRKRIINSKIIEEIRRLRTKVCPNISKYKIKVFLDIFCKENNLNNISVSTIGRIIKDKNIYHHKQKIYHNGRIKVITRNNNKLRKPKDYNIEHPGDLVQIDTVIRFVNGVRRYIITAIDVNLRYGFAFTYNNHSSIKSKDFVNKLINTFPFKIKAIQTDNGSEFHKYFMDELKKRNITHYWNYKGKPYKNGHIEKFNRTIQEEFINLNEYYLQDIDQFNIRLTEYLIWYNTKRPHFSLNLKSPVDYLIFNK